MSVSFLDGAVIQNIRNNILKLNLGTTFDASQIGEGQAAFSVRGGFATVNQLDPNVVDTPRPLDLQVPYSISLLRNNKYNATEDGYRLVTIDQNPSANLSNENKTEYFELVQPFIGSPISEGGSRIVDIKTLILNGQTNNYRDTPLGMIGIKALDRSLKENIASNVERSTVGRFNTDPISLLKGNSLIIPNRTITKVSQPSSPTDFLKAGINTTNEYLGYTIPISLIPESAIGWQEFNNGRIGDRKRKAKEFGNSKFANFLEGISRGTTAVRNSINKALSVLGVGNPYDLSTEARMEELLSYTSVGQKELIFRNLSQNQYQPGYEYRQSLIANKKLANFQANTIQNNVINRGQSSVYGLLNTDERYSKKLGFKGAYVLQNNDIKSVLKSNGMVRITPETNSDGTPINTKSYMFSIENLAWADVSPASMGESEIGIGDPSTNFEKKGKIMWFPPYDLKVDDSATAQWETENFLGRPEPVYTYNSSSRSGTLSFKVIVDHPSIINAVRGNQADTLEKYFGGELNVTDLTPKKPVNKTEDEKRKKLKNLFGNIKRNLLFVDKPLQINPNKPVGNVVSGLVGTIGIKKSRIGKEQEQIENSTYSDVESNWFNELKQNDPIIFKYLAEKIQYFHPAFHSTSPEGFNSRLTFLHQCLRQGPSITEGGSPSGNLSFGRPPVCILRIGDFYYTKVVFESLSISYDDSPWDLNPDGIGVQPMIASITMNFNFIGGSSLTGPINKLQNAISFNFFANTEVYEQRSQFWSKESDEQPYVLKSGVNVNTINPNEIEDVEVGADFKNNPDTDQVNQQTIGIVNIAGGQKTN